MNVPCSLVVNETSVLIWYYRTGKDDQWIRKTPFSQDTLAYPRI